MTPAPSPTVQHDDFPVRLAGQALAPLWTVLGALVPQRPASAFVAHCWRYAEARALLMEAGGRISAEEAERRVLILENPGAPGHARTTDTLYAGLQLILPGETAPCHRHSQSALRFVVEGEGAFTAVDGERAVMRRHDLVLTPAWRWHDHGNETGEPMIWLDGLDIPIVSAFQAGFAERMGGSHPRGRLDGANQAGHGAGLRPHSPHSAPSSYALFHYPFDRWRGALDDRAARGVHDPHDGCRLDFVDPADGGPVLPTIQACCTLISAGDRTRPRRTTAGEVWTIVEGEGEMLLDGRSMAVRAGDIVAIPSWVERRFAALGTMVLFGFSDEAAQAKLGLLREHRG